MSYANQSSLTRDPVFRGRVTACVTEQAQIFINDGRPEFVALAEAAIVNPEFHGAAFTPLVCGQPGIGDNADQSAVDDAKILSAVQSIWPTYANAFQP